MQPFLFTLFLSFILLRASEKSNVSLLIVNYHLIIYLK